MKVTLLNILLPVLAITFLLSCGNEKEVKDNFDTILLIACQDGNTQKVKSAIERGANVNFQNSVSRETPLHKAAEMQCIIRHKDGGISFCPKKDLSIVKLLVEKGAYIDAVDSYGKTPMMIAVSNKNTQLIRFLLDNGADVNFRTLSGSYPLKNAIDRSDNDIAELLLSHNAKLDSYLLSQTVVRPYYIETGIYDYLGSIQLLIDHGANINVTNPLTGETPLTAATRLNRVDVVKLLLKNKANRSIKNKSNETALDIAREKGFSEIEVLLK